MASAVLQVSNGLHFVDLPMRPTKQKIQRMPRVLSRTATKMSSAVEPSHTGTSPLALTSGQSEGAAKSPQEFSRRWAVSAAVCAAGALFNQSPSRAEEPDEASYMGMEVARTVIEKQTRELEDSLNAILTLPQPDETAVLGWLNAYFLEDVNIQYEAGGKRDIIGVEANANYLVSLFSDGRVSRYEQRVLGVFPEKDDFSALAKFTFYNFKASRVDVGMVVDKWTRLDGGVWRIKQREYISDIL
eukprot:jgi/Mesvir1/17129/Mv07561-RA.1